MTKVAENKFAGLRSRQPASQPVPEQTQAPAETTSEADTDPKVGEGSVPSPTATRTDQAGKKKGARVGKVTVAGYFSEDLSREFRVLAIQSGVTVQALLGEAIDDLFRKHGKHPFGER